MRVIIGSVVTILISVVMSYLSATIDSKGGYYLLLGFPILVAIVTTALLMAVLHFMRISSRRSRLWLGVLCGVTLFIGFRAFNYQLFLAKSYEQIRDDVPSEAVGYQLIQEALKETTGHSGFIGFLIWKTENTGYYVRGTGGSTFRAATQEVWLNYTIEGLLMIGVPLLATHLTSRHRDMLLPTEIAANALPIAHFRADSHHAAETTFRAKDWTALTGLVYAGQSPSLPALEIYQTGNVDPVTRQPYLQLIQRGADNQVMVLKTLPVNQGELAAFKGGLQSV